MAVRRFTIGGKQRTFSVIKTESNPRKISGGRSSSSTKPFISPKGSTTETVSAESVAAREQALEEENIRSGKLKRSSKDIKAKAALTILRNDPTTRGLRAVQSQSVSGRAIERRLDTEGTTVTKPGGKRVLRVQEVTNFRPTPGGRIQAANSGLLEKARIQFDVLENKSIRQQPISNLEAAQKVGLGVGLAAAGSVRDVRNIVTGAGAILLSPIKSGKAGLRYNIELIKAPVAQTTILIDSINKQAANFGEAARRGEPAVVSPAFTFLGIKGISKAASAITQKVQNDLALRQAKSTFKGTDLQIQKGKIGVSSSRVGGTLTLKGKEYKILSDTLSKSQRLTKPSKGGPIRTDTLGIARLTKGNKIVALQETKSITGTIPKVKGRGGFASKFGGAETISLTTRRVTTKAGQVTSTSKQFGQQAILKPGGQIGRQTISRIRSFPTSFTKIKTKNVIFRQIGNPNKLGLSARKIRITQGEVLTTSGRLRLGLQKSLTVERAKDVIYRQVGSSKRPTTLRTSVLTGASGKDSIRFTNKFFKGDAPTKTPEFFIGKKGQASLSFSRSARMPRPQSTFKSGPPSEIGAPSFASVNAEQLIRSFLKQGGSSRGFSFVGPIQSSKIKPIQVQALNAQLKFKPFQDTPIDQRFKPQQIPRLDTGALSKTGIGFKPLLGTDTSGATAFKIPPPPSSSSFEVTVPPPPKIKIPIIPPPSLGFDRQSRKKIQRKDSTAPGPSFTDIYSPSLQAIFRNIRGPASPGIKGFSLRPIRQ